MRLDEKDLTMETIKAYDTLAKCYRRKPWRIISLVENHIPDDDIYIADIGCGKGQYIKYFLSKRKRIRIIAIDLSQVMVQEMYREIDQKHRVLPIVADAIQLPIMDNKVYASLYIAVIHHILSRNYRYQALKEAYRVLVNKGLILVTVWALKQLAFIPFIIKYYFKKILKILKIIKKAEKIYSKGKTYRRHYYLFTLNELINEIKSVGFIIEKKGIFYPSKKLLKPTKNYYVLARKPQ
ncbi:class I SAM-dependent methyltransferase [Desulfurococcaceae archaeon MEX13E-LK6-19]|nr:class I SAM-dependent methyltransferase [Desulfurococcaceae archaeon MEX13E-LK6-19]